MSDIEAKIEAGARALYRGEFKGDRPEGPRWERFAPAMRRQARAVIQAALQPLAEGDPVEWDTTEGPRSGTLICFQGGETVLATVEWTQVYQTVVRVDQLRPAGPSGREGSE